LGIQEQSWSRFFSSTTRDGIPPKVNFSAASAFYDLTLQLLSKLLDEIKKTNDAWIRFTSTKGDLAFFSDKESNPRMVIIFSQLNDAFKQMLEIEERLQRIAEHCEKTARSIHARLLINSNNNTELIIGHISLVVITYTFFARPTSGMSFDRNFFSFMVVSLLCTVVMNVLLSLWRGGFREQQW
jgi:hypothetical protein